VGAGVPFVCLVRSRAGQRRKTRREETIALRIGATGIKKIIPRTRSTMAKVYWGKSSQTGIYSSWKTRGSAKKKGISRSKNERPTEQGENFRESL